MTADGRRFVYTSYSSRSDVWIVDNFDHSEGRSPSDSPTRSLAGPR